MNGAAQRRKRARGDCHARQRRWRIWKVARLSWLWSSPVAAMAVGIASVFLVAPALRAGRFLPFSRAVEPGAVANQFYP